MTGRRDEARRIGEHDHRRNRQGKRRPCPVRGCAWHREAKVAPVEPADFGPGLVRDPVTPEEWQDTVDMADFFLSLDAAWKYGMIEPDPQVNVERCAWIVEQGRLLHGIEPTPT